MKTDKCVFTIGVTEGYFHNNENSDVDIIKLVDECSRFIEELFGAYISFNIIPSTFIYKTEWGCPNEGEKAYTLSAVRNPKFNDNPEEWKNNCTRIARKLQQELKQETVTVEFSEVEMVYLNEN